MADLEDIGFAPFYMTVETVAADMPVGHAVKHLCRFADRMGIMVKSDINGIEVSVFPGTNERIMAERYARAAEKNAKWVASNSAPVSLT